MGFGIEEDDDGHSWIHFSKLNVHLLAEQPDSESSLRCYLKVVEPMLLVGPTVANVKAYYRPPSGEGPQFVVNDGRPGLHVVEGPLEPGVNEVIVAIEPGHELVLTGSKVLWRTVGASPELAARAALSLSTLVRAKGSSLTRASPSWMGALTPSYLATRNFFGGVWY